MDYQPHCFHWLPDGGFTSTVDFLTSSQFVLSVVPPLSWKLFIIARLVSSSASAKIFWKNALTVPSPPMLGSCSTVFSLSLVRISVVIPSQFFLLWVIGTSDEGGAT